MGKQVGIEEVAELSGVSTSTVSRVLNNGKYVTEETKQKVLEAVDELGYRPNIIARSLKTRKTHSIGLIVPDITNGFFAKIAKSVEDILNKNNYNLLLCNSDEDINKERRYIEALLDNFVDGIIFIPTSPEKNMDLFPKNMPIVAIDRKPEGENFNLESMNNMSFVSSQNEKGGYIATKHLIENGCKKIIMFKDERSVYPMDKRFKGYKRALADYNIPFSEELVLEVKINVESVKEKLLKVHHQLDFDGIFAGTDILAIGAVKTLLKLDYEIPDQVAVVGFDNIPTSKLYNPEITTVSQQIDDMGEKSAQLILEMIERKVENIESTSKLLPVELIKRGTTN